MPNISGRTVALMLGLFLAAMTSGVAIESGTSAPAGERSDLDDLLWPAAEASWRMDQNGRRLAAALLRDRVVVVSFVSADCSIVCAVRTLDLDKVARALPEPLRERVRFLALGTDPARDASGRLRAFAEGLVGASSRLRFLPSEPAETAARATLLRYPAGALPEPPPVILLFDRRGRVAMTYGSDPLDGPRLLQDIALLETFAHGLDRPPGRASTEPSTPL
ncbi:SCO family protein [Methylobacterium oryzisoli]|uniref:SCO family protein n=1 Tax=Methylobacterium oryzisoli TaxID=3385502 RepID=UPI0038914162